MIESYSTTKMCEKLIYIKYNSERCKKVQKILENFSYSKF